MRKELRKLFAIIFAFVFVFTALSINAFAENETDGDSQIFSEEAVSPDADGEATSNIFEIIYRAGMKHSDKILSLLAFITSLILALSYKKSLIPIVRGTLSKLAASVNKISEDAENKAEQARMSLNEAKASFEESKALFQATVNMFDSLYIKLDEASNLHKINRDVKILMESQIDMLYEVFISSSLPVYQKEAVGERITEMKKLIEASSGDE